MFGIGMGEFLLILIVGLIVFGPKNLPEIGKTLGKGLREFRKAQAALSATLEESVNESVKKPADETKTVEKKPEEVGADKIPPELYTGTKNNGADFAEKVVDTAEKKSDDTQKISEPARTTVEDLINTVKETPLSSKPAEEKILITKEKSA